MKLSLPSPGPLLATLSNAERGQARTGVLVAVFFGLGAVLSALWFHSRPKTETPALEATLSPATVTVLGHLDKPVDIHFYSVLAPEAAEQLRKLSDGTRQLLLRYQEASQGKLVVDLRTNADPETALADGIKGFNLDQGNGCYLGISFSCGLKKDVLPQLLPEWQSALEADISRAIEAVAAPSPASIPSVPTVARNPAVVEEVQRRIPNLSALSLEDGLQVLREDSVKEFTTAVGEMQAEVQQAQARLLQAKANGSATEQDGALKHMQEIGKNHSQRLKDLAAAAQARVDALKQIKSGSK